jgi:hypothetical protein
MGIGARSFEKYAFIAGLEVRDMNGGGDERL